MNIILVDDETAMLDILQQVVKWEELGIKKVYMARNAEEAKEILQEKKIDLTLCDIEMPKESGLDLIAWIQGLFPSVVNIILTGHADFNYARSAVSLGVFRFLLKPVSFEEVEQTIRDAVEKIEGELVHKDSGVYEAKELNAVEEVKKYLEKHYNEVITRNDVENLVHLNRDHINREFKDATGYTLMEYIQYYRICIAKKLLRETQSTVSEICIEIGYDHPAYFAKIFKKRTGLSPLEYRNKEDK